MILSSLLNLSGTLAHRPWSCMAWLLACSLNPVCSLNACVAQDQLSQGTVHSFNPQALSKTYFSEGAGVGDLNADGKPDIVYGPYWFEGPEFNVSHEIYAPKPQPMNAYADHFFAWVHDFNADGFNDVLTVGFPGTPAFVYENPGKSIASHGHWTKHQVFDWVSNESPAFTDINGDGKPELVCTRAGMFGYAEPSGVNFEAWKFTRISEVVAHERFGHALGVGDVDSDGNLDVMANNGWFKNPGPDKQGLWDFEAVPFCPGGADMFAYDVDADGLNDVITSLDAHGYGLVWWQQQKGANGQREFKRHLIMGSKPSENPYGIHVSELHSVKLADINEDGLQDIVTGKTYWSHHRQSADWDAGAVVYWFELRRSENGVEWVPHLADDSAGIGRQIVIADVDGNQSPDIVVGGMLGCHVLRHEQKQLDGIAYEASRPKPRRELKEDLSGIEAAAHMTVPEGFHVQLAAGEPQVHQPVAMAFDHRGRLWVAEAYTYPKRAPEGQGIDQIVILEDTDQDGVFDSRKPFIEGLNLVSGLEVGFGGVWVGAAPYLMFIPDADGDDVPDGKPQILLDGFGYQDTHETLNALNWGPDGWLYGCHGVFTHSKVGKPGTPENQRTPMNAAVWRYHPTQHRFEVFAWGTSNPWGVDFNDHGQAFITACVIPHLYHVIQGAHYQRQAGEHFNRYAYSDIKTIADHLHYAGSIGDHAWWGHEPGIQDDTSDAGGGHAHCGAMIYLGDNWPDRYRNQIFFNNIHGNRVNMDRLVREGSGYVGKHGDDLLMSNDRWFRGINLRTGPDGSAYLIDWYDRNACHRVNPEIWDRTNGRVYNIAYGVPQRQQVDLSKLSDEDLAELAWHKNDWFVRVSRRLLQQRAAAGKMNTAGVQSQIDKLLSSDQETRVLRGIWLAHATGLLDDTKLQSLLSHPSPYAVAWAIQLLCEDKQVPAKALELFAELAASKQSDPIVRLYLASAINRLDLQERWGIAQGLVAHQADAKDKNIPLVAWYGIEPLVALDPKRALELASNSKIEQIEQYIVRRAASDPQGLEALVAELVNWPAPKQTDTLEQILQSMEGRVNVPQPMNWKDAYVRLAKADSPEIQELALRAAVAFGDQRAFPQLRERLVDKSRPLEQRKQALDILVKGRDKELAPSLYAVLDTEALQSPAIRALSAVADTNTPDTLLGLYTQFNKTAREDAIATLVSRAPFAEKLLNAVDSGKIARSDIHAFHVRQMVSLNDKPLVDRINQSWGKVGTSSEEQKQAIEKYKSQLPRNVLAKADLSQGRLLFNKHCMACHQLFGEGQKVGPDLTGSNRADLNYILENLVAPNAVVGKDYQMTLLQLNDGRVLSGLITKETDSALTLKTINDLVVVPKDEIDQRKLSELSLMPNGLLEQMQPEEIRDIIGYLASPTQAPLRGPRPDFNPQGTVPGAIEAETMKVLQKTRGITQGQDMRAFPNDRWSSNNHLWWTGAQPNDSLSLEFELAKEGKFEPQIVLTKARDYAIIQLLVDDVPIGDPIDGFNSPEVITTGIIKLPAREWTQGKHTLKIQILGKNADAVPGYMVGIDFLRFLPVGN